MFVCWILQVCWQFNDAVLRSKRGAVRAHLHWWVRFRYLSIRHLFAMKRVQAYVGTGFEHTSPIFFFHLLRWSLIFTIFSVWRNRQRVLLKYKLPLREVVIDFYNELKSITSGYASFDYEESGYSLDLLRDCIRVDCVLCCYIYTFGDCYRNGTESVSHKYVWLCASDARQSLKNICIDGYPFLWQVW